MLGKRKREPGIVVRKTASMQRDTPELTDNDDASNNVFRRHFEAMFAPLPASTVRGVDVDDGADKRDIHVSDDESEWSGLSEDEKQAIVVVEVADHSAQQEVEHEQVTRSTRRGFPGITGPQQRNADQATSTARKDGLDEDDQAERLNLKHDLDLQRLLKESNLLSAARASDSAGLVRQKSTDLRLQSLGARNSLYTQDKMPMSHRKGIAASKAQREDQRRREAKENGIILEKITNGPSGQRRPAARRDRGVDAPGIGKFSGGTLKLSRTDLAGLQGPAKRGGKRGR